MAEQALIDRLKRYSKKCLTERTDGDFADAVWEAVEVIDGLLNDLQEALDRIAELTDTNVGKWEEGLCYDRYSKGIRENKCSICGSWNAFDADGYNLKSNFYPNCGADMRGE